MVTEQISSLEQDVVEIHTVHFRQPGLVLFKDISQFNIVESGMAFKICGRVPKIFGPGNGGENPACKFFLNIVLNTEFLDQLVLLIHGKDLNGAHIPHDCTMLF